jgi:hypothetical protein
LSLDLATLYSTVSLIHVHVTYEPEAAPFTGSTQNGIDFWSILESNMDALFLGRTIEPDIFVPRDLSEMDQIPQQGRTSWTIEQIFDLASNLAGGIWNLPQTSTSAEFYVLFLNGYFTENGVTNQKVIGLSIGGTPVIAVFKDVISTSGFTTLTQTFIEQVTLVHEMGHAMGLVNKGVPMVTGHEDADHPHHCTNEDCVMFWENDTTNLRTFIEKIINSDSDILFGQECLDDTRGYTP